MKSYIRNYNDEYYVFKLASDKISGDGTPDTSQAEYKGTFADNKFQAGTIVYTTETAAYTLSASDGELY
ncbi:MAG: hypothetical protein LUC97_10390 [Clostridiales bacterium]|nr:hypothetical protein [Clostridiales bacterium]